MKAIVILAMFLLLFVGFEGFCQSRDSSVFNLQSYLQKHVHYPALAQENKVQGHDIVSFKLNADKTMSDIKNVRPMPLGSGCEEEVDKWLKAYNGKLSLQTGVYTISVNFTLTDIDDKTNAIDIGMEDKSEWLINYKKQCTNFLFGINVSRPAPVRIIHTTVY